MLDMFQVLEAFDKYKGSMERVGKAIGQYAENTLLDLANFFELTVFCFLTGNNDMHLKNFSLILGDNKTWGLSPAYDLLNVAIVNPDDTEELALTVDGRKSKFDRARLSAFGHKLGLSGRQVDGVFRRAFRNATLAGEWISKSFLSAEYQEKYLVLLKERYDRLKE